MTSISGILPSAIRRQCDGRKSAKLQGNNLEMEPEGLRSVFIAFEPA
jgi:hypothetical protein